MRVGNTSGSANYTGAYFSLQVSNQVMVFHIQIRYSLVVLRVQVITHTYFSFAGLSTLFYQISSVINC